MLLYTCERCLQEFTQKGHLTNHMKRKNPCQDKMSKIETIAKKLIKETDNSMINSNMNKPPINNKLTVADFFCGAGGFSEGFNLAGVDVVFGLDNWKPGIETHEINHPGPKCKNVLMNILLLDTPENIDECVPDTDIIVGSPPCVSFSNSNKSGKADKSLGIQLINQYLKIILHKKTKPGSKLKYWIMENVPNSLDFVKDRYTSEELGLDPSLPDLEIPHKNILVASHYGSPQGRKRAIVGDYILPEVTHLNNQIHIDDILDKLGPPVNNKKKKIHDPSFPEISLSKKKLTDHFYDSELPGDWTQKARRLKEDHGYMGKMDFPDRTNRSCRTIMATESYCSRESIIFPKENSVNKYRAPTIRELACLMGFPIDYQFTGKKSNTKHKQIGNAVCVHMSLALANAIKNKIQVELKDTTRISHDNLGEMKTFVNLNDMKTPIFSTHVSKPKKLDSKFHIHVPYMKINQLRVELDNMKSEFIGADTKNFEWEASLHKGSGKKAKKTIYSNKDLLKYIKNEPEFKEVDKFTKTLKSRIHNSYLFQQKNCDLVSVKEDKHFAPYELLETISDYLKSLDVTNDSVSVPELDTELDYVKPNMYPINILYSLYILNKSVSFLE